MIGMKKGLFGKGVMPGPMDSAMPAYSMPQDMGVQDANFGGGGGAMPAKGGGLKNVLLAALGGAADGASQFFGGQPLIAQNQQMQQIMAFRQAEEQRRRAAELADYRTKLGIQREMEGEQGPELGTFEDNAGNVWSFDKRTNQVVGDKPFFVDQTQRTMIQDGALIRVPNPYATAAAGQSGGQQGGYSEGTMIENDQGQRMVLRNGKWEPVSGGTSGNAGGNFRP